MSDTSMCLTFSKRGTINVSGLYLNWRPSDMQSLRTLFHCPFSGFGNWESDNINYRTIQVISSSAGLAGTL